MAPFITSASEEETEKHNSVTVLVTGFSPFLDRYPVNPSWEITNTLPKEISHPEAAAKPIRVITCEKPIRVSYAEARARIQDLLDSNADSIDLVLNIGMASGRQFYSAEKYARRGGYTKHKDVDGLLPSPDEAKQRFGDCPDVMTTSFDFQALIAEWQDIVRNADPESGFSDSDCRASEDAGRFLCDYVYFNTLTWFGRRNQSMHGGSSKARPVVFLHVPPESAEVDLQRGRAVAVALIQAMVKGYQKD